MNKELEKYKKKANKIVKTIKLIGISVFLLGILLSIVRYAIDRSKSLKENQNLANGDIEYAINLEDNTIIYENNFDINISINNFDEYIIYKVNIIIDNNIVVEQKMDKKDNVFHIELENEGSKYINILVYENDNEKLNKLLTIYYIKPYQNQFIEEMSKKGICAHYSTFEDYTRSNQQLKSLGINYVRTDFAKNRITSDDKNYNFEKYDYWVDDLNKSGIKIIAILDDNYFVDTEGEVNDFLKFYLEIKRRYPHINFYEIMNEVNITNKGAYLNETDMKWYSKVINIIEESKQKNDKILTGGTAIAFSGGDWISSESFYRFLYNTNGLRLCNNLSVHPYVIYNTKGLKSKIDDHITLYNSFGGFNHLDITEYGSTIAALPEEKQAVDVVTQTITLEENCNFIVLYNMWSTKKEIEWSQQFGILRNDYTPRPAYYSMKNYYTNTNGSEYIGKLNIQSGLETHVYNKDGTPLIIAWSENTNKTYDFQLNNLTAKDLYGREITPDENGNIQITTSPVYLYNAGNNYFYQAISNVSTTKYDEFTEKFAEQISAVPGLQVSIAKLKKSMQDISNNSTLNETTALNLMKEHYNLGTTILQAYKSGTLQVEDVKVSSMLDALDDIGDSFEDLVTVSSKTRNSNITETKNLIATAEKLIKDNEDLEIIYPTKILNFSQDFYDKANYINSLEEENDIKTGLIVSKNLHSLLLANWANEFAKIYIDKAIANTPVEIEYSTTELTNNDVTATLKTDAAITVTNNQNSKTHKFTENGEFIFEYTIRGQAFTKKATVTNIDKTQPTITGVENDGFYTGSVTPKSADTNLKEVKLYKDSTLVQNYANNSTISEDGNYKIVATDKAGNETSLTFYICKIPATISYSNTSMTNKNVTATINSNYDFQVTNNSGKKTYTFTKNGTFTFNYKIKGKEFTLAATVNNIDKNLPVVTGVEEGKLYIDQAVVPKVTDENLKEVTLYLNSVKVNNFISGTQITKEGFYKIVATDKAGNETTVNFNLMKNNSKDYKVKDKYIMNITSNTKKTDFIKNFNSTSQYQITRNGKALSNNDIIATGDVLKPNNGGEYTLIVTGDINKDGDVDVVDIVKLRRYLLVRNNLDEAALLAADCNLDGESLSVTDLVKLRLIVLYKGAT